MTESEEELKSLLMKVKEESEKAGLTLNIQKTKILTSSPITSWQTEGGKVETVTDFIFLCSKITSDRDRSHEIQRCLLLGRKAMTSLSSVQSLSRVRLFTTPWTAACQASLSNTNSHSLLNHVHGVSDAIQPSHPLSSPAPPTFDLSQHQGLLK